ncbi:hypothetical protein SDC9_77712 [bioreactor metagenome]|uniref:Uncharacterized protein n=1 Tax=bioreactor metagenome TaxID=1076179 RepID=A0A644YT70_9ZZZZ
MLLGSNLAVNLLEKEKLVFPMEPFLVVIISTPLAPFVPQIAVADASLSTSMDSISVGAIFNKAPKSSLFAVEKSKSSSIFVV